MRPRDMNTIARGAVYFVKRYQNAPFDASQRVQFAHDCQSVGTLLAKHLENEENNLYPMHQAD